MHKTQTTCLVILTSIAVGFSLYYLQSVLLPFVIALFVVIGCRPILNFFETRWKLHRLLAFGVTFLIGTAALAGFGFLIWASINDVSRNSSAYEERLSAIATWVSERLPDSDEQDPLSDPSSEDLQEKESDETEPANPVNNDGDLPVGNGGDDSVENEGDGSGENESAVPVVSDPTQAMKDLVGSVSSHLKTLLLSLATSLSTLLSYGVLILIFVFFLLMGDDKGVHGQRPRILAEIEEQVRKYLVMKTVISFFTGLIFGTVLWIFGVPLAIVFGFLAFLLNFIPNIGPLIANVLPVPFLLLNSQMSPTSAIICLVLISAIQFISGNVIETRMMGKSFDVSPVVLLLSLMFFGLVWGIVGMFLATPIVSIIKIVLQQSNAGKPAAELLAGRWTVSETTAV